MSGQHERESRLVTRVTQRVARHTLRLYPLAYQRRYGEEMHALLEDRPPRARTVLDLLEGVARAHLHPTDAPADAVEAGERVRASMSGVLLCWVFFAAAGFGYYKTTEDQPSRSPATPTRCSATPT